MTASPTIDVVWSPREFSLAPLAVATCSLELTRALALKLMNNETLLPNLQCVVGKDMLFVLADESFLPWMDGVVYLGQERNCTMYVPTCWQVGVPIQILEKALLTANPELRPPFAVLPSISAVISLAKPFIPDRERLRSCLEKL